MEDVGHVVVLLEDADDLHDLADGFVVDLAQGVGDALKLGALALDAFFLEGLDHVAKVFESGVEGQVLVVDLHLFETGVDEIHLKHLDIHVGLAGHHENALAGEEEGEAAVGLEGAAVLVHDGLDIGDGAVVVVGEGLDEEGDTVADVALEGEFHHLGGILVVGLVDGALQGVLGHVASAGVLHEQTQTGVAVGVGTALAHGDGDLFQNVAPLFRALGIGCTFGSLNL